MTMITLTAKAAKQIRYSASQGKLEGMPLRVAVTRNSNDSLHYAMGFDDVPNEKDHKFSSQGIDIVVSESSIELLKGTTVDYVKLDSGELQFIFLNPNDPNYAPPSRPDATGNEESKNR